MQRAVQTLEAEAASGEAQNQWKCFVVLVAGRTNCEHDLVGLLNEKFPDAATIGGIAQAVFATDDVDRVPETNAGPGAEAIDPGRATVRQLRTLIAKAGLDHSDCIEKSELVARAHEGKALLEEASPGQRITISDECVAIAALGGACPIHALVSRGVEDLDPRTFRVTVGGPPYLTPCDILELKSCCAVVVPQNSTGADVSAAVAGGGSAELAVLPLIQEGELAQALQSSRMPYMGIRLPGQGVCAVAVAVAQREPPPPSSAPLTPPPFSLQMATSCASSSSCASPRKASSSPSTRTTSPTSTTRPASTSSSSSSTRPRVAPTWMGSSWRSR